MVKVSVIIPVYNTEQYLCDCVESVLHQTLKDIEIILVDDGSTDICPDLCDKYAQLDKRVRVIHKQNAGTGAAYNTGINAAKGEYIGFIESDDFTDNHMYEDLYNLAKKNNADVVKSNWFNYYGETDYKEKDNQLFQCNSYEKLNMSNASWLLRVQFTVWSAIYKRSFLNKYNIRYLETPGASFQDVSFSYKALGLSSTIIVTPDAYIHYRRDNENSSVYSKEKVRFIFGEYDEVNKLFLNHPNLKNTAYTNKLIRQWIDYMWNYNRIADCYKPGFLEEFSKQFCEYYYNGELNDEFFNYIDTNWFNENILKQNK